MLQTAKEVVLLIDDDSAVRNGVAIALERQGRTVLACSDLASAQVLIETLPIRAAIADIRLSGQFAFEGLDFIDYVNEKQPSTRVVLMSGELSNAIRREAAARGAVAVLQKPCSLVEIEKAITSEATSARSTAASQTIHVPDIDDLLSGDRVSNVFQPIIRLKDGKQSGFAYESLARVAVETPLDNPELLFRYAERKKRLLDIELLCVRNTIRNCPSIPPGLRIFLNVHPHVLSMGERFAEAVVRLAEDEVIPLDRFVFEITEQGELSMNRATASAIARLRDLGAGFAFDDLGIAYSHLCHLPAVRPQFLKISQHFGTAFETDAFRTKIVRNIASLAQDLGVETILEGVESRSTADAASELGITLMQGYLFGRPAKASQLQTSANFN
jgi:EAL domain-containing protein (putative c-di-GMP-specific phosphodiesterase class I)